MNADHQGSAPSFEEDSGVLGVKKELNCVPILLRLMQKGVYSSYTRVIDREAYRLTRPRHK